MHSLVLSSASVIMRHQALRRMGCAVRKGEGRETGKGAEEKRGADHVGEGMVGEDGCEGEEVEGNEGEKGMGVLGMNPLLGE